MIKVLELMKVLFTAFLMCAVVTALLFGMWRIGALNVKKVDPLDVYQREYNRCMAREIIEETACHDLAVKAAYPDRRNTSNYNPYLIQGK